MASFIVDGRTSDVQRRNWRTLAFCNQTVKPLFMWFPPRSISSICVVSICFCSLSAFSSANHPAYWQEPMKKVHARFSGPKGSFAQFGDSISVTRAFWSPLAYEPKEMSPEMGRAVKSVKEYMKRDCWSEWKGPEFGNDGSMTIRWAHESIGRWLADLNPEVAVIMFGSNDVGQMDVQEYETKLQQVVERCLTNGTVVLLTTMPPRSGHLEKARQFSEATRRVAKRESVPLIDYFSEVIDRRPADWDGSLPQFKNLPGDEYQVPTLIARDGVHPSSPKRYANVYSEAALRENGFSLRNYLTVLGYANVIDSVLNQAPPPQ